MVNLVSRVGWDHRAATRKRPNKITTIVKNLWNGGSKIREQLKSGTMHCIDAPAPIAHKARMVVGQLI